MSRLYKIYARPCFYPADNCGWSSNCSMVICCHFSGGGGGEKMENTILPGVKPDPASYRPISMNFFHTIFSAESGRNWFLFFWRLSRRMVVGFARVGMDVGRLFGGSWELGVKYCSKGARTIGNEREKWAPGTDRCKQRQPERECESERVRERERERGRQR